MLAFNRKYREHYVRAYCPTPRAHNWNSQKIQFRNYCNDDMRFSDKSTRRAVRVSFAKDRRDQTRFAGRFLSAPRTSQTGSTMLIDRPRHDVTSKYTFSAVRCGGFDDAHLIYTVLHVQ